MTTSIALFCVHSVLGTNEALLVEIPEVTDPCVVAIVDMADVELTNVLDDVVCVEDIKDVDNC